MNSALRFINHSKEASTHSIVILQKNMAMGSEQSAIAWQVIQNLQNGRNHPFLFTEQLAVSAADSWAASPQKWMHNMVWPLR